MKLKRKSANNPKIYIFSLTFVLLILAVALVVVLGFQKESKSVKMIGTITIQPGDQLLRDTIPQIAAVFKVDKKEIASIFASQEDSPFLPPNVKDWRKMEGLIPPGKYQIPEARTLEEQVEFWLKASEKRLKKIQKAISEKNDLMVNDQLILASIIEAECLGGKYYDEVAEVFLNRLEDGDKLQSCVTVEYALGFQRPYLLFSDVEVESPYNTYINEGLPPGPICAISDESLKAAMKSQPKSGKSYFFYDYVLGKMYFFEDYSLFQKEGIKAGERFKMDQSLGRHDRINKQEIY